MSGSPPDWLAWLTNWSRWSRSDNGCCLIQTNHCLSGQQWQKTRVAPVKVLTNRMNPGCSGCRDKFGATLQRVELHGCNKSNTVTWVMWSEWLRTPHAAHSLSHSVKQSAHNASLTRTSRPSQCQVWTMDAAERGNSCQNLSSCWSDGQYAARWIHHGFIRQHHWMTGSTSGNRVRWKSHCLIDGLRITSCPAMEAKAELNWWKSLPGKL